MILKNDNALLNLILVYVQRLSLYQEVKLM